METTQTTRQAHLDEVTFNLFVDCYRSVAETVRQSGLAASTVRARVRRHSCRDALRAARARQAAREGGES